MGMFRARTELPPPTLATLAWPLAGLPPAKLGTDNWALDNKGPIQGAGLGRPCFQVHDLTLRKPSGPARGPRKAFDDPVRTQITGPQASRAWPTPRFMDKHSNPEKGADGWDCRVCRQTAGCPPGQQAQTPMRPRSAKCPVHRVGQGSPASLVPALGATAACLLW